MAFDPDAFFVFGVVTGLMAFPALLNSFTHGRAPVLTIVMGVASAAMIALAMSRMPEGTYTASKVPDVFARVFRGG